MGHMAESSVYSTDSPVTIATILHTGSTLLAKIKKPSLGNCEGCSNFRGSI